MLNLSDVGGEVDWGQGRVKGFGAFGKRQTLCLEVWVEDLTATRLVNWLVVLGVSIVISMWTYYKRQYIICRHTCLFVVKVKTFGRTSELFPDCVNVNLLSS